MGRRKGDPEIDKDASGFAIESPLEEIPEKVTGDGKGKQVEKTLTGDEDLTVEDLKERLEEKKKEFEDIYDRLLRTTADFENFRKRNEREKAERIKFANEELVRELLPVIDNLERALASVKGALDMEPLIKGIEIVLDQFFKTLKKFGVSAFTSVGDRFDPTRHEAVEQVESAAHDANTVVNEFQKGYFMYDRLLRPALVSVSKHPDESTSSD
jgi:molecular chaperone GrpE